MKEEWRDTYVSDEYEVSNLGRVRSKDKVDTQGCRLKGAIKSQSLDSSGYLRTGITIDRVQNSYRIHQLVYYSFHGGEPSGYDYVIDHINSDPLDNRLVNLQCISNYENVMKGKNNKHNLPKFVTAVPYHRDRSRMRYYYQPIINGKQKILKASIDLNKVLEFKENYESSKLHKMLDTFNTKDNG